MRKRVVVTLAILVILFVSVLVVGRALHLGWILNACSDRPFRDGETLFQQGQYERALQSYGAAIRWQKLRHTLLRMRHPFVSQDPLSMYGTPMPSAQFMIANCLFKMGETEKARALHESIRERYPGFPGSGELCRARFYTYNSISSQPEYVIRRGMVTGERYFRPPMKGERGLQVINHGQGRIKGAVVLDPAGEETELVFRTEWGMLEWFREDDVPLQEGRYRFIVEYLDGSVYECYDTVQGEPLEPTRLIYPKPFQTGVSVTPTIRWEPVEGAVRYNVYFYKYWGQLIHSPNYPELRETRLTIPPGDLAPDTKYIIQINAYDTPSGYATFASGMRTEFTTGHAG